MIRVGQEMDGVMQRTIYSPSLSLLGLFVRMLITQFFIYKVRGTHCSLSQWDKLPSSTGMISADKLVPGNSKVSCSCKKSVALPVCKLGRWWWGGYFHNSLFPSRHLTPLSFCIHFCSPSLPHLMATFSKIGSLGFYSGLGWLSLSLAYRGLQPIS